MSQDAFTNREVGFLFWTYWVLAHAIVVGVIIALALTLNYIPHAVLGWGIIGISIGITQLIWFFRSKIRQTGEKS